LRQILLHKQTVSKYTQQALLRSNYALLNDNNHYWWSRSTRFRCTKQHQRLRERWENKRKITTHIKQ